MAVETGNRDDGRATTIAGAILCGMFLLAFAPAVAFMYNLARTEPFTAVNHAVTCVAALAALPWAALLFVHVRDSRRRREQPVADSQSLTLLLAALTLVPAVTAVMAQSLIIGALLSGALGVIGLPVSTFMLFKTMRGYGNSNNTLSGSEGREQQARACRQGLRKPLLLIIAPLAVGAAATLAGFLFTATWNAMIAGATGIALFAIAMAAVAAADVGGQVGLHRKAVLLVLTTSALTGGGAVTALFLSALTATMN